MNMEKSVTKRIAKNFSWMLSGNIIGGGINFFIIVYIARVLGAYSFGLYQLAQAFLLYLVLLVDSGLSILGMREIAMNRGQASAISLNIFGLRLLLAMVVFCLSVALIIWLPLAWPIRWLFISTFLMVFYRALNADWVCQGLERMEYSSLSRIIYAVSVFLLIILFIKNPNDLIKAPLIQVICGTVVSVLILFLLYKYLLPFDLSVLAPGNWRSYLIMAIPLGASVLMVMIYDNIDTIMLGLMDKPAIVGYYNAAYRVFYIFNGVFATWLTTAAPVITKKLDQGKAGASLFLERYFQLTMLFLIPATVLVFLAAKLFIDLIFGPQYGASVPALQVLIWALVPMAFGSIFGTLILIPAGLFNEFFYVMAGGALVNLIMNFILIPRFSFVGAAIATIVAYASVALIARYLSRHLLSISIFKHLITPLIITICATISFIIFDNQGIIVLGEFYRMLLASFVYLFTFSIMIYLLEKDLLFSFARELLNREPKSA